MAIEALEHMGQAALIPQFEADYFPRLTETEPDGRVVTDWEPVAAAAANRLAPNVAALAGHGLLRLAHSIRAVRRKPTDARRNDISAAVAYWETGTGAPSPTELTGSLELEAVVRSIPRIPLDDRFGMLTVPILRAATDPRVRAAIESLRPATDIAGRFDDLAMLAIDRFLAGPDESAFMFIHGVTVPTMARELLPLLDPSGARQLEAAVAVFSLCALATFDLGQAAPAIDDEQRDPDRLAVVAAASLDDHTIKFTDACIRLAARTGSALPLMAVDTRIGTTHG